MAHFVLIFIFGFCSFKVLFFVLEKIDAVNKEIKNKQAPPYSADNARSETPEQLEAVRVGTYREWARKNNG